MTRTCILWGPAGTGKTTAGTLIARTWFEAGAGPWEVAYLGFTRAAARAAAQKILGDEEAVTNDLGERFPLFRTLHSLAYMGMRRANPDVRVLKTSDMKKFSTQTGFDGAYAVHEWEDLAEAYQSMQDHGRTQWDQCRQAYALSRVCARTSDEAEAARMTMSSLACRSVGFLPDDLYQVFVQKYEDFKRDEGLVDFTDMLTFALTLMPPMDDCRYVIVDEAQDLSPILHEIVSRVFRSAEEIWWVGDDYQAIYGFAAASAELFLERARTATHQLQLRQTHRFGQSIVDFSDKIIKRVQHRMPKEIIGVQGKAGRVEVTGEFRPVVGNRLILHRHVAGCQALASAYIDAGLPFSNERGKDPLGAHVRIKAWRALDGLAKGERITVGSAALFVEELLPSTVVEKGVDGDERTRFVTHGGKKKMSETGAGQVSLADLEKSKILTEDGVRAVRERQYSRMKHSDDLEYYDRVVKHGYDLDGIGAPVITTIHGAKGRQADAVTVFSEMGRRCWEDPDTEHRLAYVASTRTKGDLEICAERRVEWAGSQYDYPTGGNDARRA